MLTQGFGEVIIDILTTNPLLSSIPSASAILDTSNYTINSITYGKDANGFKYHAHTISSIVGSTYNDNFVQMVRYNTVSPSSYHSSATHIQFSSIYSSIPCYPSVYDIRLERLSTLTNYSGTQYDAGHYINLAIDRDPTVSGAWNIVGGFPPSGNVGKYKILNSAGAFVTSGNLSGVYNTFGIIDVSGYVKVNELNIEDSIGTALTLGPKIAAYGTLASFSSTAAMQLLVVPQMGDAASLAAFGGVNHIGVWALDIKSMLRAGLNPPYGWNAINNSRKYKLIAKATFWRDLLNHNDVNILGTDYPGYKTFLVDGTNSVSTLGPGFVLIFNFK